MTPLTIGQVARHVGITADAIRYYERQGLLPEPRRSGAGYRQYTMQTVTRLRFIQRAKRFGFTLGEIKDLIALHDNPGATRRDIREIADGKIDAIDDEIRHLRTVQRALARVSELCEGDDPARSCPVLRLIAGPLPAPAAAGISGGAKPHAPCWSCPFHVGPDGSSDSPGDRDG